MGAPLRLCCNVLNSLRMIQCLSKTVKVVYFAITLEHVPLIICKGILYLLHHWSSLPDAVLSYEEGSCMWDPQPQPAHSDGFFYRLLHSAL